MTDWTTGHPDPAAARSNKVIAAVRSGVVWVLVLPVRIYQVLISPLLGPRCRFYPSCSSYAVGALRTHGPLRGVLLAGWRVVRCNPWNPGGVDDVPPPGDRRVRPEEFDSTHIRD